MKKFLLLFLTFSTTILCAQDLKTARKSIDAEQYENAQKILESLVQANPQSGEAFLRLGNLYLQLGEDEKARATFNQGLQAKDNGKLNYVGLGRLKLDAGDEAAAEMDFANALKGTKKKDTKELVAIAEAYNASLNPNHAKAIEYANRAITANSKTAEAYLAIGDAEYANQEMNAAYAAYRSAYNLDNSLLRAKLQLAVLTKSSGAFPEAIKEINDVLALNPEYGPAYRELAETYYLWSNYEKENQTEYIAKALENYEKYMQYTDYSLDSRMRHADFLILTKNYKLMEQEAREMQKIDQVNPRILRYLGISAFENKNYDEAIRAISQFIATVDARRVVAYDYEYLAKALKEKAVVNNDSIVDRDTFTKSLDALAKGLEKGMPVGDFKELAVNLYTARKYLDAAEVFRVIKDSPEGSLVDYLYFANSILNFTARLPEEERVNYQQVLLEADAAYATVIEKAPLTQDAYFNRGNLNRMIISDQSEFNAAQQFEGYIRVVLEKGDEELEKSNVRKRLSDAYTHVGAYYAEIDKAKSIENFEKAVEFNPENEHAAQSLSFLKGQ